MKHPNPLDHERAVPQSYLKHNENCVYLSHNMHIQTVQTQFSISLIHSCFEEVQVFTFIIIIIFFLLLQLSSCQIISGEQTLQSNLNAHISNPTGTLSSLWNLMFLQCSRDLQLNIRLREHSNIRLVTMFPQLPRVVVRQPNSRYKKNKSQSVNWKLLKIETSVQSWLIFSMFLMCSCGFNHTLVFISDIPWQEHWICCQ